VTPSVAAPGNTNLSDASVSDRGAPTSEVHQMSNRINSAMQRPTFIAIW